MVKQGDLVGMKALLEENRKLANSRSETGARGTYPLHVVAEFGHRDAARVLLEYGADVTLLDFENDAIALGWAAFFVLKSWPSCSKLGPSRANATSTVSPHSDAR